MLTADRLRELLDYNPTTGIFTWVRKRRPRIQAGDVAGTMKARWYVIIEIDGKKFFAHRLAWLYVHGEWPSSDLDHVDTVKSHNWIANLRLATKTQNNANSHARGHNKSGLKGVNWFPRAGKWRAAIRFAGKNKHLGLFTTPEAAHAAYIDAAKRLHGEFARAR
jgi:hypothetical protein